jgi:hypothetical protein
MRVAAPGWIRPARAIVFVNGQQVAEQAIEAPAGKALDTKLTFRIERPAYDAHVVCVALGDGVKLHAWKTYADYTIGVTNPIFLDVDRNGTYESPRNTARRLIAEQGPDRARKAAGKSPAVAAQLESLLGARPAAAPADSAK